MSNMLTKDELMRALAAEIARAGTQKKWAAAHGLSEAYLSDVKLGRREPGEKLLRALGRKRVVLYEKREAA